MHIMHKRSVCNPVNNIFIRQYATPNYITIDHSSVAVMIYDIHLKSSSFFFSLMSIKAVSKAQVPIFPRIRTKKRGNFNALPLSPLIYLKTEIDEEIFKKFKYFH